MKKYTWGNVKFEGLNDEAVAILKSDESDWSRKFHKIYCYGQQGEYFDRNGDLKRGIIWYLKKGVGAWDIEEFIDFILSSGLEAHVHPKVSNPLAKGSENGLISQDQPVERVSENKPSTGEDWEFEEDMGRLIETHFAHKNWRSCICCGRARELNRKDQKLFTYIRSLLQKERERICRIIDNRTELGLNHGCTCKHELKQQILKDNQ